MRPQVVDEGIAAPLVQGRWRSRHVEYSIDQFVPVAVARQSLPVGDRPFPSLRPVAGREDLWAQRLGNSKATRIHRSSRTLITYGSYTSRLRKLTTQGARSSHPGCDWRPKHGYNNAH